MQWIVREQPAMKCPDTVHLSREDGEALRIRLARDALTADDRRVLDHVLQWYFWLLVALQEATFSLKRLRALVFGETRRKPQTSPPGTSSDASGGPPQRHGPIDQRILSSRALGVMHQLARCGLANVDIGELGAVCLGDRMTRVR
jgi:hypothetical protein